MAKDLEILAKCWNEKYSVQPYEKHHLHYNYEDLVLKAMNEFGEQCFNAARETYPDQTGDIRYYEGDSLPYFPPRYKTFSGYIQSIIT